MEKCVPKLYSNMPRFLRKLVKYDLGLSCRWAFFTAWVFGFKCRLIIHSVEFIKLVYWCIWRIFMVGTGAFRVLMRASSCRSCDTCCRSCDTCCRSLELGLRLGLKPGFKELRPKLELLNRGLRQASFCGPFFSTQNQGNSIILSEIP